DATKHNEVRLSYAAGQYTVSGFSGEATLSVYSFSGVLLKRVQSADSIACAIDAPSIIHLATSTGVVTRKLLPR
ncbi:MAG: hypothetical protein IKA91_03230, partial [Bacteroidaceae bacterium]|nr:hypothetical protein [Bacteroidaceae bacterium]